MFYQFNDIPEFKENNLLKEYPHDAGWDIRSGESLMLRCGHNAKISTGLHLIIPKGFKAIAKSRSGLAVDHAIECTNAGVLDYGYTGEIFLRIYNNGINTFKIDKGMKIAQVCFNFSHTVPIQDLLNISIPQSIPEITSTLFHSLKFDRGNNGLGSTGRY
jgi:dUTP pyrophosphatase